MRIDQTTVYSNPAPNPIPHFGTVFTTSCLKIVSAFPSGGLPESQCNDLNCFSLPVFAGSLVVDKGSFFFESSVGAAPVITLQRLVALGWSDLAVFTEGTVSVPGTGAGNTPVGTYLVTINFDTVWSSWEGGKYRIKATNASGGAVYSIAYSLSAYTCESANYTTYFESSVFGRISKANNDTDSDFFKEPGLKFYIRVPAKVIKEQPEYTSENYFKQKGRTGSEAKLHRSQITSNYSLLFSDNMFSGDFLDYFFKYYTLDAIVTDDNTVNSNTIKGIRLRRKEGYEVNTSLHPFTNKVVGAKIQLSQINENDTYLTRE